MCAPACICSLNYPCFWRNSRILVCLIKLLFSSPPPTQYLSDLIKKCWSREKNHHGNMEYNTIPLELLSLGVHGKEPDSICGKWISPFIAWGWVIWDLEWGWVIWDLECSRAFLPTSAKPSLLLLLFCGCRAAWATLGLMGMELKPSGTVFPLAWSRGIHLLHQALRMPIPMVGDATMHRL